MSDQSPFDAGPDRELGELLRESWQGPDPIGFRGRLEAALGRLPERASQWDVLAGWARPSVVAVAAAAGLLLGMAWLQSWRNRVQTTAGQVSVSVALLEPTTRTVEPIIYSVLEDQ
jgi:hypothetical protein